jgi:hypothetical protein
MIQTSEASFVLTELNLEPVRPPIIPPRAPPLKLYLAFATCSALKTLYLTTHLAFAAFFVHIQGLQTPILVGVGYGKGPGSEILKPYPLCLAHFTTKLWLSREPSAYWVEVIRK